MKKKFKIVTAVIVVVAILSFSSFAIAIWIPKGNTELIDNFLITGFLFMFIGIFCGFGYIE